MEYKCEIKMGIISKENFDLLFNNKVKEIEIDNEKISFDIISSGIRSNNRGDIHESHGLEANNEYIRRQVAA